MTHAADLGFVFDTIQPVDGPSLYDDTLAEVRALAADWSRTLASFARHGDPHTTAPEWSRYLPDRACLIVDQPRRTALDLDRERQLMWGDRIAAG